MRNHFLEQQRLSSSSPLSTDVKLSPLDPGNNHTNIQNRHYCAHPDCNKVIIITFLISSNQSYIKSTIPSTDSGKITLVEQSKGIFADKFIPWIEHRFVVQHTTDHFISVKTSRFLLLSKFARRTSVSFF